MKRKILLKSLSREFKLRIDSLGKDMLTSEDGLSFFIKSKDLSHNQVFKCLNEIHAQHYLPLLVESTSPSVEDFSNKIKSGFTTVVSDEDLDVVVGFYVKFSILVTKN